MANVTYTVVKGDTLSKIATKYNTTVDALVKLNNISNRNLIYVDQVLIISGSAAPTKTNTSSTASIKQFGLLADTDNQVFATWSWDKSNTEKYQVKWYYYTANGIWFVGNDSTVTEKESIYSAPSNALKVKFLVKPISKTHTVNKKETSYWTASWSTAKFYDFSNNPPSVPSTPTVNLTDYKILASLDNISLNATSIQFQIVRTKNGTSKVFNTSNTTIRYATSADEAALTNGQARYTCNVSAGGTYKVRARSVRDKVYSDWSEYSSEYETPPSAPATVTVCKANSETSVYLEWPEIGTATSYDIEYTTDRNYFDGSDGTTTVTGIEFTHYEKTGLDTGEEYFFRVRAVNNKGESAWSGIKSVVLGKKPAAPTTWSSTTTAITGEILNLYWIHNAEDESSQTFAELELIIDGVGEVYTIKNTAEDDDENKTSVYTIDTSGYVEGTKIQWRVRTAGITKVYGDWSIQRTVDVYAPPTLSLNVTKNQNGDILEQLETFPFYVSALAGPNTQTPIGYQLVIAANEAYETVDDVGNTKTINAGDTVYSKYFDITSELLVEFSANNIDLENNIEYTITCSVTMNSGLTAEGTYVFPVSWTDVEYEPNAEIAIDTDNLTASIRPYCEDENGTVIEGILLSVYRREFDGSFTEIIKDIPNSSSTFVTDPHPALDYARYRIVAKTEATGAVSYYDVPGYPIGEKAVIIQWNEDWSSFDSTSEEEIAEPSWAGSLLKLPYNIDVSDKYGADVSLVKYIGRKRPVTYYGTQLGESSSWNVAIDKSDSETLYALRRLAIWMGDVYVREPSGSGYWANITVSFGQKHLDLTIPVTLDIVRVEGGM